MNRTLASLLLGACAFVTAHAAQRLIAPFAGLGLTLYAAIAALTLAGFALGCLLGAPSRAEERAGPLAARALFAAAVLALLAALLRRPLLVALSGLELRLVVLITAALFAGLPAALLGFAFSASQSGARTDAVLRAVAGLVLGAALAAPLAGWVLVPRLGLTLSLVLVAIAEAIVALLLGVRRAPLVTTVGALGVLIASVALATRPAAAAKLGPRLLAQRTGHEAEYRVFDRDGARYLVADGSIQTVIDTLSGDCVQRVPAALELLRLMRPGRDSMLVLGLRGGGLPLSFARSGWRVRVVEPDSDAVAVARIVAYKPGETPLEVADPRAYLRRDTARHSVIALDTFAGSDLPWTLCTREFVALLADRLLDDGLVVVIVEAHGWGDPLVGSLGATLRTRFPHVIALPTSEPQDALGSIVLLASRKPVNFSDERLPDLTTYFQNPDALWFAQQLSHAWLNRYEPRPANALVLTDDRSPLDLWADRINHATRRELHAFFGPHGGSW